MAELNGVRSLLGPTPEELAICIGMVFEEAGIDTLFTNGKGEPLNAETVPD